MRCTPYSISIMAKKLLLQPNNQFLRRDTITIFLIIRAALAIDSAIHNPNSFNLADSLDVIEGIVTLFPKPKEEKEQGKTE